MANPLYAIYNGYQKTLNVELRITQWVQQHFTILEPILLRLSEYCDTGNLMNILVPLVGVFHQELLMRLVCALSVTNALNSSLKWLAPETRPYWRLRELYANGTRNTTVAIAQYHLSCDASAGWPCTHTMSFTIFFCICCSYLLPFFYYKLHFQCTTLLFKMVYGLITIGITSMWLSRLYLGTEFLHQIFMGTFLAIYALFLFERNTIYLYSRKRSTAVLAVLGLAVMALLVYFIKLELKVDPHWATRQAFKWCPHTKYLRHETSIIFMLARDLGSLMGVALSCPLFNWNSNNSTLQHRFLIVLGLEIVNYMLRNETPKQYGRFTFLAYEFIRNMLHSFILLKFISKLK